MAVSGNHRVGFASKLLILLALYSTGNAIADTAQYRHAVEPIGTVRQAYDGKLDPDQNLVVAMWSALSKPVGMEGIEEFEFFKALSAYFDQ